MCLYEMPSKKNDTFKIIYIKFIQINIFKLGGAFKTMPISPKDTKPILTSSGAVVSESENQGDLKPSPPTVFTFTNPPITSSELNTIIFSIIHSIKHFTYKIVLHVPKN